MHNEAMDWVRRHATEDPVAVLDIGGRDVGGPWGGSVRPLFPNASTYRVLDIEPGPDVDVVANAATWTPDRQYDVVVCCEVFEHTPDWLDICRTALAASRPGGQLILTMAGPGRAPHGALGEQYPGAGEYYGNVDPARLWTVLFEVGWRQIVVDAQASPADMRAVAVRPKVPADAREPSTTRSG